MKHFNPNFFFVLELVLDDDRVPLDDLDPNIFDDDAPDVSSLIFDIPSDVDRLLLLLLLGNGKSPK